VPDSESVVQDMIRLGATKAGCRLWRNNVGVLPGYNDTPVRYGLANESKAQNELVKSADLIGIMPVVIRPEHVGMTLGVFMSIECKREGWRYNPNDPHQVAQAKWAEIVTGLHDVSEKKATRGPYRRDTNLCD